MTSKSIMFLGTALLTSTSVFAQSVSIAEDSALLASDQANGDRFATSSAMNGDQLIVGAPFNALGITSAKQGAAYMFIRSGTSWTEEFRLTASDGADGDQFGTAVAVAGDWAAVGAPRDQDNGPFSGSVYLFQRSGTAWIQSGKLTRAGGASIGQFGQSLAMDGDTLLIGAPTDAEFNSEGGAVFVYVRTGSDWNLQDTLLASDNAAMDLFGTSVDLDGDRAAVGSPMDESPNAQRGKAYVFLRSGTTWAQEAVLGPFDAGNFAHMGRSVALQGELLVAGAPERTTVSTVTGAAYVFRRTGTAWGQEQILVASDGAANDFFGAALDLVGTRVVIGAPFQDELGSQAGAAYLFEATGTMWSEVDKFFPSTIAPGDRFGSCVTFDESRFAVCSPLGEFDRAQPGLLFTFRTPEFLSMCFGDGGVSPGCTQCPCGNDALPGSGGGCLNSAGASASLSASGDVSVTLPSGSAADLRFAITGAPPLAFCILNSGDSLAPGNPANPCFGLGSGAQAAAFDGLRCAIMNTRRHGGRSADANGEVGTTNNPWGGEGGPPVGIAVAGGGFASGQTRFFQVINRDEPLQVCQRGLNTSNAVGLMFFP